MAHNEDDGPPQVVTLSRVPASTYEADERIFLSSGARLEQAAKTNEYLWLNLPEQPYSQAGLNQWGVCIASDNCPSREGRGDFTDGGIGPMLRQIVIERVRSAREGARLIGELVERFGYQASGRTYIISDPEEAWLVCLVQGRHWLAWRVPDDEVCVIANSSVVREIDPTDEDRVMASTDIVSYATERRWYDPERDVVFDFARTYADSAVAHDSANYGRQWSMLRRFAAEAPEYGVDLPASIKPKRKVGVADLMAALRDHYEDTDFYHPDPETGNPHMGNPRTVCTQTTQNAFVAQLRRGEPRGVQLVWWISLNWPCTSCFIPFHYGIPEIPAGWQSGGTVKPDVETWESWMEPPFMANEEDAFTTALNCRARVSEDYQELVVPLRDRLDAIEADAIERQSAFEKEVLGLWSTDPAKAAAMLFDFSTGLYASSQQAMADALRR
jgi:dipeptidase